MIGLLIFLAFVAAVAFAVWDVRRKPAAIARPLPAGSVQMPLDVLHALLDDLDTARHHATRLRLGMERLINNGPTTLSLDDLETAKAMVEEATEVGL